MLQQRRSRLLPGESRGRQARDGSTWRSKMAPFRRSNYGGVLLSGISVQPSVRLGAELLARHTRLQPGVTRYTNIGLGNYQ